MAYTIVLQFHYVYYVYAIKIKNIWMSIFLFSVYLETMFTLDCIPVKQQSISLWEFLFTHVNSHVTVN